MGGLRMEQFAAANNVIAGLCCLVYSYWCVEGL